uniref:M24 family metallopeptidase n=1 Tax=Siminovitchia sp. FSL W7-1587 TaxID=2954699 RepID=UPI00403EDCB7
MIWCILNGYCSDITRTFSLGHVSEEKKEVFEIALEAQKKAVKAINQVSVFILNPPNLGGLSIFLFKK